MELALVLASLMIPPDGQCYHGANIDQYPTGDVTVEMKLRGFEEAVGKETAIMGWFTFPRAQGRDTRWSGNQKRYLERCRDADKFPLLSFTFGFLGEPGWAAFDEWLAGKWDAQLEEMARVFREFGLPILLAINSEMNGNWAPYSVDARSRSEEAELAGEHEAAATAATADGYIASWRYIHDFLRERGCDNVAFCFVASAGAYARPDVYRHHFREYFPGEEYVDWIGFDTYNNTPTEKIDQLIAELEETAPGKPIIVKEWGIDDKRINGYPGGAKAYPGHGGWIDSFFDVIEKHPSVKAVCYFQRGDPYRIDRPGAEDGLAAYRKRIADPRYLIRLAVRNLAPVYEQEGTAGEAGPR